MGRGGQAGDVAISEMTGSGSYGEHEEEDEEHKKKG